MTAHEITARIDAIVSQLATMANEADSLLHPNRPAYDALHRELSELDRMAEDMEPETTAYYVTVIRGERTGWLLGPYATHAEALARVDAARIVAQTIDPYTVFDAFGTASRTARVPFARMPAGRLNDHRAFRA
jgi:hypothetical protein